MSVQVQGQCFKARSRFTRYLEMSANLTQDRAATGCQWLPTSRWQGAVGKQIH